MMKQVCINCHVVFGEGPDNIKEHTSDICSSCLKHPFIKEIARRFQRKNGHFDCCGSATDYCDQQDVCAHRENCF